jgi:predicted secreted protein
MSLFENAIVFVVIWWLVLFMTLPFGAGPPEKVERGMADSAPAQPRLGTKMLVTTAIALILTLVANWIAVSGLITFREPV